MEAPLFAPGSVIRRVHREPALLLGGRAALLMQVAHPLVATGVAQHSSYRDDPLGRLRRTLSTISLMIYGTESEARAAAARVNALHRTVKGVTEEGVLYAAMQPELLLWVYSTLVDCALRVYEAFVTPLAGEERSVFYEETKVLAHMFGVPHAVLPDDLDDLRAWMLERIDRGEVRVTPLARDLARPLLSPLRWVPWWAVKRSTPVLAWLLPESLREGYGLPLGAPARSAVAALQGTSRVVTPRTPGALKSLALRAVL